MNKKTAQVISLIIIFASVSALAEEVILPDGFVLAGTDGKLVKSDTNDTWLFELDSNLTFQTGTVKAGTKSELLPCSALEKAIADIDQRTGKYFRMWGRATKYNNKNFIFAVYLLPLTKVERSKDSQQSKQDVAVNEPDDELALPEEIVKKLQTPKILQPRQLEKPLELKEDHILANRTGFIRKTDAGLVFDIDAIGRNVRETSLALLPCKALQQAQHEQSFEPDPIRFKISGIVTVYKGKIYLLPQRAVKTYSHGNFR